MTELFEHQVEDLGFNAVEKEGAKFGLDGGGRHAFRMVLNVRIALLRRMGHLFLWREPRK